MICSAAFGLRSFARFVAALWRGYCGVCRRIGNSTDGLGLNVKLPGGTWRRGLESFDGADVEGERYDSKGSIEPIFPEIYRYEERAVYRNGGWFIF